jgi:starch-binding outer membrane protein, SusD/RagB family
MTTKTWHPKGARMFSRSVIALAATLTLGACSNLLDTNPPDQAPEEDAIVTPAGARTALAGAYAALQSGYYYGGTMTHFGDLYADNAVHTGTFTSYQEAAQHDFFADNGDVLGMWQNIYNAIKRTNAILAKVPSIEGLDEVERDQILGEAHFLRALSYHNLVKHFGPVPIRLEYITDPDEVADVARAPIDTVYAQILADLTEAEALITNETSPDNHASLGAVRALFARVYLYQGDYPNALIRAQEVEDMGYELAQNYRQLFDNDNANTPENIFKLTFTSQIVQANLFGYYWLSDALDVGAGRFEIAPSQGLIDAYDTTSADVRLAWNIAPDPGEDDEGYVEGSAYGTKWPTPGGAEDFHVIRFAEVILIKAEALARDNQLGLAVDEYNRIRERAGLAPHVLNTDVTTQAEVLAAIDHERRLEFAEEGDRFSDLTRDPVRAQDLLGLPNANRLLFPIPKAELDVSPLMTQNPGY